MDITDEGLGEQKEDVAEDRQQYQPFSPGFPGSPLKPGRAGGHTPQSSPRKPKIQQIQIYYGNLINIPVELFMFSYFEKQDTTIKSQQKYSGPSVKGHPLERTPLLEGHKFLASKYHECM